MRFQDKVVVVTGAAGGIGTAIATRFASEGARVVVTDVNAKGVEATAEAIRAEGGRARGVAGDISKAEGCKAVVADVLARNPSLVEVPALAGHHPWRRGRPWGFSLFPTLPWVDGFYAAVLMKRPT